MVTSTPCRAWEGRRKGIWQKARSELRLKVAKPRFMREEGQGGDQMAVFPSKGMACMVSCRRDGEPVLESPEGLSSWLENHV